MKWCVLSAKTSWNRLAMARRVCPEPTTATLPHQPGSSRSASPWEWFSSSPPSRPPPSPWSAAAAAGVRPGPGLARCRRPTSSTTSRDQRPRTPPPPRSGGRSSTASASDTPRRRTNVLDRCVHSSRAGVSWWEACGPA